MIVDKIFFVVNIVINNIKKYMNINIQRIIILASILLLSGIFIYTYFFDQGDWIDCSDKSNYSQAQSLSCGFNKY